LCYLSTYTHFSLFALLKRAFSDKLIAILASPRIADFNALTSESLSARQ
jgi:hypothetical protein